MIQQRSPVYNIHSTSYISALTNFIEESKFKETLWLSSIDAAARTDEEFSTPILTLFPPTSSSPTTPLLSTLAKTFPPFNPAQDPLEPKAKEGSVPHIPGSLLTKKLLQHASTEKVSNLGALLYFAAEGDTRQDAHNLANLLLHILSSPSNLELKGWGEKLLSEPPSWSALFGRPPAPSLYS